jgi:outer membrane protein assembly factor BamB
MIRYDSSNSGYNPRARTPENNVGLDPDFSTPSGFEAISLPILANGRLYSTARPVDGEHTAVVALDSNSGETVWRQNIPWENIRGGVTPLPMAAGGGSAYSIVPGSGVNSFSLEDGSIEWGSEVKLDDDSAAPIYSNNSIYMGDKNRIVSLEADSGEKRWEFQARNSFGGLRNPQNPYQTGIAVSDDLVFFVARDEATNLYALSASNGEIIWQSRVSLTDNTAGESLPVVSGNTVYALGEENNQSILLAFDKSDGSIRWRTSADSLYGYAASEDGIYLGFSNEVVAVSTDGTQRWRSDAEGALPVLTSQFVILGQSILDAETGDEVWRLSNLDSILRAPSIVGDESIFGLSGDGRIFKLINDGVSQNNQTSTAEPSSTSSESGGNPGATTPNEEPGGAPGLKQIDGSDSLLTVGGIAGIIGAIGLGIQTYRWWTDE